MSITNITPRETKLQADVAELDEKLEYMTLAFGEWITKTQWVQDTIQPGELGMHRADVIKSRFDELQAKLAEAQEAVVNNCARNFLLEAKLAEVPMTTVPNPRVIEIYDTCDQHPDAPHGYLRDASHNAGRYVCECEFWTPGEEL